LPSSVGLAKGGNAGVVYPPPNLERVNNKTQNSILLVNVA
jgi:hypothetical protein